MKCQPESLTLNCGGSLLSLSQPIVMGILNTTPDSFFSDSRATTERTIKERASNIIAEGAGIIDIGACSTRPFAAEVTETEELQRMRQALRYVREELPDAILSVDTFRASVARMSVEEFGAAIVNDVSGGDADADMYATVARLKVAYVCMHMQGTPQTMQLAPTYTHIVGDVITDLSRKVEALRNLGVKDIIIDPGFGFGKTLEQNYMLLKQLDAFHIFGLPLLAGVSRKSMIHKLLNVSTADSLNGTTVVNTLALSKGAHILRVHDVKAACEAIRIISYMHNID
ncbi:MAG: dihydropteroate synthase [Bacteroidaceae bacterium]|nr:dihydropteroate synthase [Bacteroidaceae bacterium]